MELISLTTGSWFPRTKLHLKEYFTFLKEGTSHLELDAEKLKALHKALMPRDVKYIGGTFDRVTASFDGVESTYSEDGLLLITSPVEDLDKDLARVRDLYEGPLTGSLTYLYSIGTPIVAYHIPHIGQRTVVLVAKGLTDDEARIFCAEHDDDIHFIARHTDRTVYFSDKFILINDETGGAGATRIIVEHLILFREYEHKLRHYFELHRNLWEDIAGIQERETIPAADLPVIRDTLLNHKRDLAVIRARIKQMRSYLIERQKEIDVQGLQEAMQAVEAYRFGKLDASTAYIEELWDMLEQYLESTIELTGFLYQENLQKEIGVQQFIFLVSAVAGVLALGAIAGSTITFFVQGQQITGQVAAYHLRTLLVFGGAAIVASLLVFYVLLPLIKAVSRINASRLLGRFGGSSGKRAKKPLPPKEETK